MSVYVCVCVCMHTLTHESDEQNIPKDGFWDFQNVDYSMMTWLLSLPQIRADGLDKNV